MGHGDQPIRHAEKSLRQPAPSYLKRTLRRAQRSRPTPLFPNSLNAAAARQIPFASPTAQDQCFRPWSNRIQVRRFAPES